MRVAFTRALHLAVLSALAVAQPLFDVLGGAPEFFVVRGSTATEIVLLALVLALGPPVVLVLLELLAGVVRPEAAAALHLVFVGALVALLAVQAVKRIDALAPAAAVAGAVAIGAATALLYARAHGFRMFVTVLAPAPIVFVALFLANAPLDELWGTEDAQARPAPAIGNPAPVVWIVFDELPTVSLLDERRRIDPVRYPAFAKLARDGIWFRRATTVHEHTTESIPAMLDGKLPKPDELPTLQDHPENLFTLLRRDYRLHVAEPVTRLCPKSSCPRAPRPLSDRVGGLADDLRLVYLHVLLPADYARELPPVDQTWQGFGDHTGEESPARRALDVANANDVDRHVGQELWRDQRHEFATFVRGVHRSQRPSLHFMHSLIPHSPWRFLPSGKQYPNSLGIEGLHIDTWTDDPWVTTQGWQRHLLQVGFTDRLLGQLLARLEREGLYDRALIVVNADHGVSFTPGDRRRGITRTNLEDIAPIPLLVKLPRNARGGTIDDRDAMTIDILPTIADALDARVPWRMDGRSLLGPPRPPRAEVVVHERQGARRVSAPAAEVWRAADQTLARKLRTFGSGKRSLYAIGANRALIGRAVTSLPSVRSPFSYQLDGASLLRDVDPSATLIPTYMTGSLDGAPAGLELAVAVNGRIAAVTRSYAAEDAVEFAAMIPESSLRRGENGVELYAVRGETLERLTTGGVFELVDGGGAIRRPSGRVVEITRGDVGGHVEDWFIERASVRFGGWAADVDDGKLPDRVLAFLDGRLVYSGGTTVERPDLEARWNEVRLRRAGWVFEMPRAVVGNGKDDRVLRFYAVRDDHASELTYARGFPWRASS